MAKEKINIVLQGVNNTQKAFNDVKHKLSVLDKKTKTLQKGFATVAKSSVVAFTAISVVVGVSTARIDKLVKTSQKLGIGVEFLQKFRFASEQVGIQTQTADMALQRFSRRVAEARKGTGEAKDTLKQLGIALFDSSGQARSIEDVMFDVADAMSKTEDSSEQVRQAFKFFDSEGVALVALMKNGSGAMKDFFNDAQNLGGVLSGASAQGVADFADETTRLKTLVTGLADNFTAGLAPALQQIVDTLIATTQKEIEARGGFEKFGNYLANEFLGIVQIIILSFEQLSNIVVDVLNTIRTAGLAVGLIEETEAVKSLREELENLGSIQYVHGHHQSMPHAIKVFTEEELARRKEINDEINKQTKLQKMDTSALLQKIQDVRENLKKDPIKIFDDPEGGDGDGETPVVEPRFVRNMRLAVENFKKTTIDDLMVKGFQDAFQKAEDALVDFIRTGKLDFKNFVDSVLNDLARLAVRRYITLPFMDLFGVSGDASGGSSTGVGLGDEIYEGGGYTGMGARAGGIDGRGGFPAILHPNETVIDHQQGQTGGVVINQSINFATGVQDTVRNEVLQLLPNIAETSKSAVAEAMQRGGNFRRTFR